MQVRRVLQAYLDGETDKVTVRRVAVHLADCRRCGLEARTYRGIKDALARHEPLDTDMARRLRGFGESLAHRGSPEPGGDAERTPGS